MTDSEIEVVEQISEYNWWILQKFRGIKQKVRDLPDNLRLAALGAWRGRERGMAVFAGVFPHTLHATLVPCTLVPGGRHKHMGRIRHQQQHTDAFRR